MFNFLLAIDPVAFEIFGLEVRWYALCILGGALLTLFFSQRIIKSYGYGKELLSDMFLYALIGGLIGTRLWYILANLHEFLAAGNIFEIIWAMISVWDGGLAVQGGVLLGTICGFWFLFKYYPDTKKYPKALIADVIIPNILIAQVLGRWGNFFNQEVYGKCVSAASWEFLPEFIIEQMSVCHSPADIAVPLFLIEGVINLIGWVLITFVLRYAWTSHKDGYLSAFYFIWYGIVRLCLEPLRSSEFQMSVATDGIPTSMVMSALYVIGGIIVILLVNYNARISEKERTIVLYKKDVGTAVFLSIITFGVYFVIWMNSLIKAVNSTKKTNTNSVAEMLCILFVPFYSLYWWYSRGEYLKRYINSKYEADKASNSGAIYLIFGLLGLPIISAALFQKDLNQFVLSDDEKYIYIKNEREQIESPKEVLKKNILTLSIANAYYKMRTTKYLSRNLENNNYGLDTFMTSLCPFYWFKFYKKYGELCVNELNERGLIVEGYESNEAFFNDLKNKCYIPFGASYVLAKGMNTLYANDLGE